MFEQDRDKHNRIKEADIRDGLRCGCGAGDSDGVGEGRSGAGSWYEG